MLHKLRNRPGRIFLTINLKTKIYRHCINQLGLHLPASKTRNEDHGFENKLEWASGNKVRSSSVLWLILWGKRGLLLINDTVIKHWSRSRNKWLHDDALGVYVKYGTFNMSGNLQSENKIVPDRSETRVGRTSVTLYYQIIYNWINKATEWPVLAQYN